MPTPAPRRSFMSRAESRRWDKLCELEGYQAIVHLEHDVDIELTTVPRKPNAERVVDEVFNVNFQYIQEGKTKAEVVISPAAARNAEYQRKKRRAEIEWGVEVIEI